MRRFKPGVGSSQASVQSRHRFKPGFGSGQASDMCTRIKGSDPCLNIKLYLLITHDQRPFFDLPRWTIRIIASIIYLDPMEQELTVARN